jgi:hypothetical protein
MNLLLRQFIHEILSEVSLTGRELAKPVGSGNQAPRFLEFLNRIKYGIHFELNDGRTVRIPDSPGNRALILALKNQSQDDYNRAMARGIEVEVMHDPNMKGGVDGLGIQNIKWGESLRKDRGFRGGAQPLKSQNAQINQINTYISGLKSKYSLSDVNIQIQPGVTVPVSRLVEAPGGVKQDAVFESSGGAPVGNLSLKSANSGPQMRGWGGFKTSLGHAEVDVFMDHVRDNPQDLPCYRHITDVNLSQSAVYGGIVDLVIAEKSIGMSWDPSREVMSFTGNVFHPPTIPGGTWEPVLFAFHVPGRHDFGFRDTRLGFYPYGFAASKGATNV